jgi:threonine synthase
MGLPIAKLIIATNSNDILARTLATGTYGMKGVAPTLSPSMDIQISSNFERLLFDLYDRDGAAIAGIMQDFRRSKSFTLAPAALQKLRAQFVAGKADDKETLATIKSVFAATGELLDPHTAVGVAVGRKAHNDAASPLIILATAHPAKFPGAVKKASGIHPALPKHLSGILKRKEKSVTLGGDVSAVKWFIEKAR